MIIKNKKAISHVEVIISFIIFVSFVSFLFVVFNPFKYATDSKVSLDITENKILENVSTNLKVFSIKINSTIYPLISSSDCFKIENKRDIRNFIIRNLTGDIINASIQGDDVKFENKGEFYRVYVSDEIEEISLLSGVCIDVEEGNYTLGVTRNYKVISNKFLHILFENYNNDYEKLKDNLGIKNEFYMQVMENARTSNTILEALERYKPQGIEIRARTVPIEILNKNGNLKPAVINIQVWE
jgi:hypothetical protein